MPSCQLFTQSGGISLISGNPFSGLANLAGQSPYPAAGMGLKLSKSGAGPVYIGLTPFDQLSGFTSGTNVTQTSGGSLSSGGIMDGVELVPGECMFVPKSRLPSGLQSIRIAVPAASSGSVLFWDWDTRWDTA